jgi:hypothetical protein
VARGNQKGEFLVEDLSRDDGSVTPHSWALGALDLRNKDSIFNS